jgi:hypothetical protein
LALVCNIDQRGRKHRYRIGFAFLALAVVVYGLAARFVAGDVPRLVAVGLAVAGLFSLFEANRGWCVMRAMGFKTKL